MGAQRNDMGSLSIREIRAYSECLVDASDITATLSTTATYTDITGNPGIVASADNALAPTIANNYYSYGYTPYPSSKSETEDVADSSYTLTLSFARYLNIVGIMLPRADDLSGSTVSAHDSAGNELCAQTYDSPALDGTSKYIEFTCNGLLKNYLTSMVKLTRNGKVSVVQVGLLYPCTCGLIVGTDLSPTAITVSVGSPVTATLTIQDYVSPCAYTQPSSYVLREAGTSTVTAIGSVTVTGSTAIDTSASISFDPLESQEGLQGVDLYAIVNSVEMLIIPNI